MRKKNFGYTLLFMLVITGLAGTLSTNTLTSKERKFATNYLKETRNDLIKSVKGLSEAQLNFKPAPDRWSVKECVQHIALAEKGLWQMVDNTLKQQANPEKRAEIKITDEALIKGTTDRSNKFKAPETIQPEKAQWKTIDETLNAFKEQRNQLIQYIKTTTEDMRNHVTQGPGGAMMDAYQLVLLISGHTNRHTQQLNEVKADPNFPKN